MLVELGNITSKVFSESKDTSKIIQKLSEYLSVLNPNRFFVEAFKKGYWDGKERFLTKSNIFPTGLLPFVQKFCKNENIELKIDDQREYLPKLPEKWDYFLGNLELREYQKDIIKKLYTSENNLFFVRGIINAATNAGKDYVMASIFKNLKIPTLLIIHNTEIYRKAVNFFSQFFKVGEICSGFFEPNTFTVAMQKSLLYASNKDLKVLKYLSEVKCLMVDEGHRAIGKEYQTLLSKISSPIRLLFSGTPLEMEDDVKKMKLVGSFGPELIRIKNDFLIDSGFSQKPLIEIYNADNYQESINYRDEYEKSIIYSKKRLKIISSLCKNNPNKQILISFSEIAHGKFLLDNLLLSGVSDVDMVSGEDAKRAEKIDKFKTSELRVLLSSMILKEGVNIPNIQMLILAHGGKSAITIKQYIGRALRHDGEKDNVNIVDFFDHGDNITQHSKKRFKLYENEGFEVKFKYNSNKFGKPL